MVSPSVGDHAIFRSASVGIRTTRLTRMSTAFYTSSRRTLSRVLPDSWNFWQYRTAGWLLAHCLLILGGACQRNGALNTEEETASQRQNVGHELTGPWFTEITRETGLNYVHAAYGAEGYFFPAIMAPGVALLDYDQDGYLDIFVVNGMALAHLGISKQPPTDPPQTATGGNRLWRQGADGRFTDVTAVAGLDVPLYGMGIAIGDVNNDGYPDIYVSCYGADHLFLNRKDGTFEDITRVAGIDNQHWGASAVFFDFDRDGWLDLFVTNYVDYDPGQPCLAGAGQDFCNPAQFLGTPDRLYRNISGRLAGGSPNDPSDVEPISERCPDSAGTESSPATTLVQFEDVSLSSGIARKLGPGLGVTTGDLTGDNWPDIYVANDGQPNFLWVNQRDGTFRDEAPLHGVAYDAMGRRQGSMGIAMADVNRDGLLDMLVTNLDGENNSLYLSQSGAGFREASTSAGLGPSYPHTGFGAALVDLNHNGRWELLVVNGRVRRAGQSGRLHPTFPAEGDVGERTAPKAGFAWSLYAERNLLFQEQSDGIFQQVKHSADPFLNPTEVSRALAIGDIDNDGDLDLVVTNSGGALRLLRNDAPKDGHWLSLRVLDSRYGNRDAYGAQVTLVQANRKWTRVLQPGSSYLSSHDPRLHFGLGEVSTVDRIEVIWSDGLEESFPGGPVDQFHTINFGAGVLP